MTRTLASLLLLTGSSFTLAAQPLALPFVVGAQQTANATLCESFKGDKSPLGKAMNKQCRDRASAEFDEMQDEKTLKECMKPGNVIDNDVRKCMKGL